MSDKPIGGAGRPKMQWFPLYVSDFEADTKGWPVECIGAMIVLMCYQWTNGSLPNHQKALAGIAGVHDQDQWGYYWKYFLKDKFTAKGSKLLNNRLQREYIRISKKNKQARDAAFARWRKQTTDKELDADACTPVYANKEQGTKNKDKDTISPTGRVLVPHQKIVDLYHECCPQLPSVKVLSEKRKAQLRARWKNFEFFKLGPNGKELHKFNELVTWERYFKFITEHCSFMAGENDRGWVANFDFCIRESAMINVMENKYVDRKK